MDYEKKVKKVVESDRIPDILLENEAVAELQTANLTKIPDVEFTKLLVLAVLVNAKKEYFDTQRHVPGAATRLEAYLKTLANMYFVNGEYFEKRAIALNDPSLINDLGYKYYNTKAYKGKLPLEVRNTDVLGELFAIPKGVDNTRFYNLESTVEGSTAAAREEIIKNANGDTITGFTSGDLVMFRSQAVDMAGNKSEWTPYFVIRVK